MATIPTTIELDEATRHSIDNIALARKESPSVLLQQAVEQFVFHAMQEEQFRLDTLAAIQDFDETGLHLTGEEVNAWLLKRAAGEQAELPECHR